ncbi:hypothetical protein ACQEVS_19790 [Streptomyces sp. CA-181903]|uniref:hypothetical protein n=1 Tax=Streptomyces sp. CA-181903 TaxID=3240055 RepID=UPI003D93D454
MQMAEAEADGVAVALLVGAQHVEQVQADGVPQRAEDLLQPDVLDVGLRQQLALHGRHRFHLPSPGRRATGVEDTAGPEILFDSHPTISIV